MVTALRYQPFNGVTDEETEEVITSGAACTFNVTVAGELVFPATSIAVPLNDWFAPGVVTGMAAGQVATPDSASTQVKLTITAPLAGIVTIPFTAAGVTVAVIVGGVLSMFNCVVVVAV